MIARLFLCLLCCASLANSQNPLPLQQGNIWEYASSDPFHPDPLRMEVLGDTLLPNGRSYLVLTGSLFGSPFLRLDSSRIYAYSFADSTEFKLFDFNAASGDTIAVLSGGTELIVLQSTWVDSVSRRRNWEFVFYRGIPPVMYDFMGWWLSDSIGVTYLWGEPGNSWHLSGARLAGDTLGTLTAVKAGANVYPEQPVLKQNYPNPFNPSTTIPFSIPRSTYTTLKIYNTLGQEIATLVSDNLTPGIHSAQWNATNVASGVYYYRLTAGDFVQTKKLLLLR